MLESPSGNAKRAEFLRKPKIANQSPAQAKYIPWRPVLVALLIVIPLGFATKFYHGPAEGWVNNSLGGVFYEIFWCLVIGLFWPRGNPLWIALTVFFATCLLEFLQLIHPPFLEYLRSFFIGRTILGNSFSPSDFLYYASGAVLGYGWIRWIISRSTE